jgi:hypothetical protein
VGFVYSSDHDPSFAAEVRASVSVLILRSSIAAGGGGDSLTHGQIGTISASGLGVHPDYNTDNHAYQGQVFLPWIWSDLSGFPASGSSQATFENALSGLLPSGGAFSFDAAYSAEGITIGNGGPSRGGKYMRMTGASDADDGYVFRLTPGTSPVPAGVSLYISWWTRWSGAGKYFRLWQNGGGEPNTYFTLSEGFCREGATTTEFFDNMPSPATFRRHEIWITGTGVDKYWVDGTALTWNSSTNLPLFLASEGAASRDLYMSWPNSIDTGDTCDVTDIYVSFSTQRVELDDGTRKCIQVPISWDNTNGIQYVVNGGNLTPGTVTETVYGPTNNVLSTASRTLNS